MLDKQVYLNELIKLYVYFNPYFGTIPFNGQPELKPEHAGLVGIFMDIYPKFQNYNPDNFKKAITSVCVGKNTKTPVYEVLQFCKDNHSIQVKLPQIDYNDPLEAACKGLGFQETLEVVRNWNFDLGGPIE